MMMMAMTSILRSAVLAACLGASLASSLANPAQAAAPSQFYTWDPAELALAKQKVAHRAKRHRVLQPSSRPTGVDRQPARLSTPFGRTPMRALQPWCL
jgi:hypothetical protein